MRKFTKLLLVMMCMILTLSFGMSIKTEAANTTSGTLGDNDGFTWTYDADTKTLTITGEDSGLNGNGDRSRFLSISEDVETIILKDCTIKGSMVHMFANLDSLKSVQFQNVNTSDVTYMNAMFWECRKLSSVDMSGFQTENVIKMSNMFYGCSSLKSVDVSNFDTGNVTDMRFMFARCSSLSSVDVSNFDTRNVTDMRNMFYGCTSLSSLDVSNFDTRNVTNMRFMFYCCKSLSSLNVSNFDTGNVTDMTLMLSNCTGLSSLDLSNFDLGKATVTNQMLADNSNLIFIKTPKVIPETISINLPATYYNLEGEIVTKLTKDICGITLLNSEYRVYSIALNISTLNVGLGDTGQLTEKVYPNKAAIKTVTWKSSNTAVAKVDANGKVTPVALGTATITATATDGSGKSASCEVTVIRQVTGIALNQTSVDLETGDTYTLTATVSPDNASDKSVTWKSSNAAVAKVDANGKITAVKGGTATITATANDGSGVSASCDVTVIQPVTYLAILSSKTMGVNESYTFTASINASATNKELSWTSSNPKVVTIDASGKATAVGVGSAKITVTAKDGSGMTDTCDVTVIIPVEEIILDKTELQINKGSSYTLSSTIIPSNATNKTVVWYSQYPEIATVDVNTGKVTAVEIGTTEIAALSQDTYPYNTYTICKVTVTQPVTGISLDKDSLNLKTGDSTTLTATIAPSDAYNKAVAWKSSNTKIATVDTGGKVTAVGEGTATITVNAKDGSGKSASCTITVKDENPFADVKESSWMYPFVKFVYDHNIVAGKGKTAEGKIIFDPENYMTRAEFVQTLYNKEGKPAVTYTDTFTDVPEGQWYTNANLWAFQKGIVAGKGDQFDISGKITREEAATILYKYATNYKKYDTSGRSSLDAYEDADCISSWAVNNMKWAIHYGIMKGRDNLLAPRENATRAECATMLKNFIDAYNK